MHVITPGHPLYAAECRLREAVLLRSAGYDFAGFARDYPHEDHAEHHVAVLDHPAGATVIGCALLLRDHPVHGLGKVTQVAVDPQRQGEGIGRRLMIAVESRAFGELGLRELFCHAQLTAAPFYDHLGWQRDGETFQEAGIEHVRMVMRSPSPPPNPALSPPPDQAPDLIPDMA